MPNCKGRFHLYSVTSKFAAGSDLYQIQNGKQKRTVFDVIGDHLALTHIIKSKAEPVNPRIKRLLELISSYSFNFYYMKGKDMI